MESAGYDESPWGDALFDEPEARGKADPPRQSHYPPCPPRTASDAISVRMHYEPHTGEPPHSPLVIVDDPASRHGQRMARVLRRTPPLIWIVPTLQLPSDLLSVRARVIALPLRVRGAHRDDRFTTTLLDALRRLRLRGCQVFVAQGPCPNLLAEAGIAIAAPPGGPHTTASEACVAAAEAAFYEAALSTRAHHG